MYYQYQSDYEQHCNRVKNELTHNPSLINNELYIFKNLPFLGLNFVDFSKEIKNNAIFILQYFTYVKSNKKEYELIPPEFLTNPIFLKNVLIKNPDIYLFLSEEQKNNQIYKMMEEYHPLTILKYASKELLENEEYCKKIVSNHSSNYRYAPENVRSDKTICKSVFFFAEEAKFIKYLPKACLNDKQFIQDILQQPESLHYLPSFYQEDFQFCLQLVFKNSNFFKYISPLLKNNNDFVSQIISHYQQNKNNFTYNLTSSKFDISHILKNLPISYFDNDFLELFHEEIHSKFAYLNKEQRASLPIIKTAFNLFRETSDSDIFYNFITLITDNHIKQSLKEFCKTNKYTPFKNLLVDCGQLIESYYLHEELQHTLTISSHTVKKIKL